MKIETIEVAARSWSSLLAVAAAALLTAACTSGEVTMEYSGVGLQRPDRILVYDFAASAGDVKLDRGLSARIIEAAKSGSPTEQEMEVGRRVAAALSEHLVKEIRDLGLPAQRASGEPAAYGSTVMIEGQFLSINEGNRTERVIIGLGAGRSDVETHAQAYQQTVTGPELIEEVSVSAKGGRQPGAAETMGIGALTGNLLISAAVTAGGQTADETLGGTVEADASRTAKDLVKKLKPLFVREGWISD